MGADHLRNEVKRLAPVAKQLGYQDELQGIIRLIERGTGYQIHRQIFAITGGDFQAVVRDNVAQMNAV